MSDVRLFDIRRYFRHKAGVHRTPDIVHLFKSPNKNFLIFSLYSRTPDIPLLTCISRSLAKAPYYIIIARKNQVLLSFLDIRVVVNNNEIYPLLSTEPVVIPVEKDYPKIVVTDGYHFTKPLELTFKQPSYFNFNVVCAIDDLQLLAALLILAVLYMLGFLTGFFFIKLLSFTPIVWVLFYYYINRKNFIRIVKAGK